jgi:hypothetical protein
MTGMNHIMSYCTISYYIMFTSYHITSIYITLGYVFMGCYQCYEEHGADDDGDKYHQGELEGGFDRLRDRVTVVMLQSNGYNVTEK